jgi:hypothetical protein
MTRVVLLYIDILRSAGIWVPGILVGPEEVFSTAEVG